MFLFLSLFVWFLWSPLFLCFCSYMSSSCSDTSCYSATSSTTSLQLMFFVIADGRTDGPDGLVARLVVLEEIFCVDIGRLWTLTEWMILFVGSCLNFLRSFSWIPLTWLKCVAAGFGGFVLNPTTTTTTTDWGELITWLTTGQPMFVRSPLVIVNGGSELILGSQTFLWNLAQRMV